MSIEVVSKELLTKVGLAGDRHAKENDTVVVELAGPMVLSADDIQPSCNAELGSCL